MTFPDTYPEHYAPSIKEHVPVERLPGAIREGGIRMAISLNLERHPGCPRGLLSQLDDAELERYIPHATKWMHGELSDETFAAINDAFTPRRRWALLYAEAVLRHDGDFPNRAAQHHLLAALAGETSLEQLEKDLRHLWDLAA